MASTKCILGLIAGVAAGALAIVLLASAKTDATPVKKISEPDAFSDALKDSFSGWLDRLKKGEPDHSA